MNEEEVEKVKGVGFGTLVGMALPDRDETAEPGRFALSEYNCTVMGSDTVGLLSRRSSTVTLSNSQPEPLPVVNDVARRLTKT